MSGDVFTLDDLSKLRAMLVEDVYPFLRAFNKNADPIAVVTKQQWEDHRELFQETYPGLRFFDCESGKELT